MKTPLRFLLLALACSCYGQAARDARVINNVTVDLTPVRQWFTDRKGERPMQHWKQIRVTDVKSRVSTYDRCMVKMETGEAVDLLIANLPAEIRTLDTTLKQQAARIEQVRAVVEKDAPRQKVADAVTPKAALGSQAYVDDAMNRRAAVNLWGANIQMTREQLAKMELAHAEQLRSSEQKMTEYAMSTGRKLQGLEIWDCGRKKP